MTFDATAVAKELIAEYNDALELGGNELALRAATAVLAQAFAQAFAGIVAERDAARDTTVALLCWEEITQARSAEDPTPEVCGWEAPTAFGIFYNVEEYFGSDSLGWEVTLGDEYLGEADDPDVAKGIAQSDFANRICQALGTPTHDK